MNLIRTAVVVTAMLVSSLSLQTIKAQCDSDAPFGFATMLSRTESGKTFDLTGGGCYTYPVTGVDQSKVITLTAEVVKLDDEKSDEIILNAIKNHDVVVFDGSKGDIVVKQVISLSSVKDKTLLGINNVKLVTKWFLTAEDRVLLDEANVKKASTSSGTGGTLSNGKGVDEQAEFLVRKILIEKYGKDEPYRQAGVFAFDKCQNVIIRNIKFVGPGSVDCGGSDLLGFTGCTNMWVDHCEFTDGIDGNFDITKNSDFCTVSWCTFSYTERAYMHMNTNLVGSSDSDGLGKLNITFAYNHWGNGCDQRMPMARSGKIHMLNNYFTCTTAKATINPRKNSEFLIEGNTFDGVKKIFSESGSTAYVWVKDGDKANVIPSDVTAPASKGMVTMPYTYTVVKAADVPEMVKSRAGTTLFGSTSIGDVNATESIMTYNTYNILGQKVSGSVKGLVIRNGKKCFIR